ncbi:MAG: hypothetical protein JNL98_44275, partial [Bryobacterales bacterium]|nr:hypothetical protein [Bryobacterales bacterium]
MASSSFPPLAAVYREEQSFDWRCYALVLLAELLVVLTLYWMYQNGTDPLDAGSLVALARSLGALVGLSTPVLALVGLL